MMDGEGYNVMDLLWCIDCKQCHGLECPLKGRPILISDSPTVPHAVASLPRCLHLQTVAGKRLVVAKETISERTMFGPMEAVESGSTVSNQEGNGFVLKVFQKDGCTVHCVQLDTSDERCCNWMTLVTPATAAANQNLMVHQYQGSLYFTSTRVISAGEELRVWYAPHYAAQLGQLLLSDDDMCASEADLSVPSMGSPCQSSSSSYSPSYDNSDCESVEPFEEVLSESSSLDYLPVGSSSQMPLHTQRTSYATRSSIQTQLETMKSDSSCSSPVKIQTISSETLAKKASLKGCLQGTDNTILKRRERKTAARPDRDSEFEKTIKRKSARLSRRGRDIVEESSETGGTRKPSNFVIDKVEGNKEKLEVSNPSASPSSVDQVGPEQPSEEADEMLTSSPEKNESIEPKQNCVVEEPLIRTSERSREANKTSASKGNECLTEEEFCRIAERVRGEGLRSCFECCMILDDVEQLKKHIMSEHEREPVPCPNCEKTFVSSERLKDHIQNIHEDSSQKDMTSSSPVCPLCEKRLGSARTYRKHLRVLHTSVFTCMTCHCKLWNNTKYQLHTRDHRLQALQSDTTEMFNCEECGRQFPSKTGLKVHHTLVHVEKKFSCQYCKSYSTSTQVTLKEHILSIHPENNLNIPDAEKLPCDGCSAVFLRVGALNHHRRTHEKPKFKCQKCQTFYCRQENLLKHSCLTARQRRVTVDANEAKETSPSNCNMFQCPKTFRSKSSMNHHTLTHQKQRFTCGLCNREFHKRFNFENHKYLHLRVATSRDGIKELLQVQNAADDVQECNLCVCNFTKMNTLIQHLQNYHKTAAENILKCIPCQRVFLFQEELEEHTNEHILIPIPPNLSLDSLHSCGICGRVFKNAGNLAAHEIVHTSTKSHMCEFCGETYRRVDALRLHLSRRHLDKGKKYKCKICNKSFKSDCLRAHIQSHNDQHNYKCPHCERTFIQRGNYNRHVISHSQKKVHQCQICNKGFKHLENLHRHQLNTKDHKFSCSLCKGKFSSQNVLANHIKKAHHMQEVTECKNCGRKFKYLQSYLNHMKRKHSQPSCH